MQICSLTTVNVQENGLPTVMYKSSIKCMLPAKSAVYAVSISTHTLFSQNAGRPGWPGGKAFASRAGDTGSAPRPIHTGGLKTDDTLVATLPHTWHCSSRDGTGWRGVNLP